MTPEQFKEILARRERWKGAPEYAVWRIESVIGHVRWAKEEDLIYTIRDTVERRPTEQELALIERVERLELHLRHLEKTHRRRGEEFELAEKMDLASELISVADEIAGFPLVGGE